MKRIVIVSAVFPPEQVTSALMNYDLARELSRLYKVTVLRPSPTRPIGMAFDYKGMAGEPFETILIDSYTHPKSQLIGRFKESVDFGRKCAKYIYSHRSEIDFVYNDGWQLFGLYLVAKTCKKHSIPYMVPIQDIYPECLLTNKSYPTILRNFIKSLLLPIDKYYQKYAYRVRTISDEMADYLSKTRVVNRNNYLVLNNWQNDEDFLKDYPAQNEDGKLVFAYVGSINIHANVDLMIRAFAEANIPNSEFRIYGGGNQKEICQQLANDLGLPNVTFGFVSRKEIPAVQATANVLLLALPTGNGNLCLPSKLTSYLLSGRPVLASVDQESTTKRILEGEGCGKTVAPDDKKALISGLKYYSELNKESLIKMGEKGRKYAMTHLTREINLSLVTNMIKQILQ